MFNGCINSISFSSTKSINSCSKWSLKSFKFVYTSEKENSFFFLSIDSLLINNEDNPNECHSNSTINDGTTSTTNGNTSLICCVCQDRASGRHYGVLSCEVINN
jgi:hypothetical protein